MCWVLGGLGAPIPFSPPALPDAALPFFKQDGLLDTLGISSPRGRNQIQELTQEEIRSRGGSHTSDAHGSHDNSVGSCCLLSDASGDRIWGSPSLRAEGPLPPTEPPQPWLCPPLCHPSPDSAREISGEKLRQHLGINLHLQRPPGGTLSGESGSQQRGPRVPDCGEEQSPGSGRSPHAWRS